MKTKIDLEIKTFSTPDFVIPVESPKQKQDGYSPSVGIPLRDLSPETLDNLCNDFRREIFRKAERQDPREK